MSIVKAITLVLLFSLTFFYVPEKIIMASLLNLANYGLPYFASGLVIILFICKEYTKIVVKIINEK